MTMIKEGNNLNNLIFWNVFGIEYKFNYQEQTIYFKIQTFKISKFIQNFKKY